MVPQEAVHYVVVPELMFAALEMIDPVPTSVLKLSRKTTREILRWNLCYFSAGIP